MLTAFNTCLFTLILNDALVYKKVGRYSKLLFRCIFAKKKYFR